MNAHATAAATAVAAPDTTEAPTAADGWQAAIDTLGIHLEHNRWTLAIGRALVLAAHHDPDIVALLADLLIYVHSLQTGVIETDLAEARIALQECER